MSRSRVGVTVVLTAFTIRDALEVMLVRRAREPFKGSWALPSTQIRGDEDLDDAARRLLRDAAGHADAHLEQLYTFGDPGRDPAGHVIAVAYLAVLTAVPKDTAFHAARRPPRLAFDHADVLGSAVERLRTKTEYSTVPLRFLSEPFTLSEVQRVYEVLLDRPLDKRNFRRKMLALEAIEQTAGKRREGAHRPARLFRLSPARPYLLKEKGILFPF